MTNKLFPRVVFTGVVSLASACQVSDSQLKTISAGHTGCTPDQITITKTQEGIHLGNTTMWNATCNGKVYVCSGLNGTASAPGNYSCAPEAK